MELEMLQLEEGTEIADSTETHALRLAGSWTINRAHELKQILMEALKSPGRNVLELEDLTETDLSLLQLFCSAHRASLRSGNILELHEKKSDIFKRIVRDAGFKRNLGCHKNPRISCLWTGEWEA